VQSVKWFSGRTEVTSEKILTSSTFVTEEKFKFVLIANMSPSDVTCPNNIVASDLQKIIAINSRLSHCLRCIAYAIQLSQCLNIKKCTEIRLS
jgi:hypothetical protein